MQENTTEKKTSEKTEYYIVSEEVMNWIRGMAYTKLTMSEVDGFVDQLWSAPTLEQYLDLQESKKPKIITR